MCSGTALPRGGVLFSTKKRLFLSSVLGCSIASWGRSVSQQMTFVFISVFGRRVASRFFFVKKRTLDQEQNCDYSSRSHPEHLRSQGALAKQGLTLTYRNDCMAWHMPWHVVATGFGIVFSAYGTDSNRVTGDNGTFQMNSQPFVLAASLMRRHETRSELMND